MSYDPKDMGPSLAWELRRLERQAELSFEAELRILEKLLTGRTPSRVLDLGCGSGAFTRRLRDAWPATTVVGADIDGDMLALVAEPTKLIGPDETLVHESESAYELIIIRYVAQHLSPESRGSMWARCRAALAEGGHVVVIDVDDSDWGTVQPQDHTLEPIYQRISAFQTRGGSDRSVVGHLPDELKAAGFIEVSRVRDHVASSTRPIDDFEPHLSPTRHAGLVVQKVLSLAEMARLAAAWQSVRSDPDAFISLNIHAVHATNPSQTTSVHTRPEGVM
ncbi:class I SAM-dependent methyltransferase [Propioniferax innocua]|uniref:Ubiquinone/menaquinone biosynthesis C-methylase UbiE n=1 Tax=Propioniferax innocua TaxID=1753 RepID=A0A542ZAG0_9ACTN|nr:class I SAM-dependent methyltransferase [Propioniferax innocua]TQL57327.1 ubiquinone/menaquinone biosynthesis C-methylase UbiE [Propioniferax innocua]